MFKLKNVYYINLDERKDRKELVEKELTAMRWEYQRFPAIKHKSGRVGCSMSHLALLEMAKEKDLDYIVIVEDDIQFTNPNIYKLFLVNFFKEEFDYDVLLLAGNIRPPIKRLSQNTFQVYKSWTTTGYIVRKHYYDTLIHNIQEGISLLVKNPLNGHNAIDSYWMKLQEKDKWLIILPRTVTQRPDYSDIENKFINYDHFMLDKLK